MNDLLRHCCDELSFESLRPSFLCLVGDVQCLGLFLKAQPGRWRGDNQSIKWDLTGFKRSSTRLR